MLSKLKNVSQHILYIKLILLLFCIAFTATLMQAGSIFLLDYIPYSQSAIGKINLQKIYWHSQLVSAKASQIKEAEKRMVSLREHYIDSLELQYSLTLAADSSALIIANENVKILQEKFEQASDEQFPIEILMTLAQEVILSYEQLDLAIHRDYERKQSVTVLLQLIGLVFIMICIMIIALELKRILINRLGNINKTLLSKLGKKNKKFAVDEFSTLEQNIVELTAQLESYITESTWADKTNVRAKELINAQEFLFNFLAMVNKHILSERMLLKMLYSLERAMHFSNVAIIYTDDAAVISTERVIYSNHMPSTLRKEIFDELETTGLSKYEQQNEEGVEVCCLGVTFSGTSGGLGILLVEMEKTRFLEESEIKVLEIIAQLLTMVTKFQSHDEEGRRIAVLEERAAIARELHDSLAQSLSYMKIQIARLQSKAAGPTNNKIIQESLGELRESLDDAYRGLRELLTTFRAHMDLRGLGYAIQSAIDEFSQRSRLSILLDNRLVNCRLTVNEEFHILHVVREALSNIVRHSRANNVSILMLSKKNDSVVLTIDDDGVGYTPTKDKHNHHGQTIMKERARSLGGSIEVMTKRHGGTRVQLIFTPKLTQ